jgi:hypothetical protein
MRYLALLLQFVFTLYARLVLISASAAGFWAAWAYYGYKHIGCHPMFASANIDCGPVPVLAAEHALSIVRAIAPFQQDLLANQNEMLIYAAAALNAAVMIELALAVIIIRRRSARKLSRTIADTHDLS